MRKMKSIVVALAALLLASLVYTQRSTGYKGFELYHKFYELPNGDLKFFYCEIGGINDVRVEYKKRVVTDQCHDYDRQNNQIWKECTVLLNEVERAQEGIVAHRMTTSGSVAVELNGQKHHVICGHKVNATECLVSVFGTS